MLLSNEDIRVNIALRLGADIVEAHSCSSCGNHVERNGNHGLSCRYSKGRHPRHQEANNIISRALASAGFAPQLEPPGLSRSDGKRPDGLTRTPWKRGMGLLWDFTCADSFAPSRLRNGITNASDEREEAKRQKYAELTNLYIFAPVSVETLGIWGTETLKFLKELGRKLSDKSDDPRSGYFLRQRLSVCVARGNTQSVLATIPSASPDLMMPFN